MNYRQLVDYKLSFSHRYKSGQVCNFERPLVHCDNERDDCNQTCLGLSAMGVEFASRIFLSLSQNKLSTSDTNTLTQTVESLWVLRESASRCQFEVSVEHLLIYGTLSRHELADKHWTSSVQLCALRAFICLFKSETWFWSMSQPLERCHTSNLVYKVHIKTKNKLNCTIMDH